MAGIQNEKEKRIHVPWMFMEEWKNVYEDVYSGDLRLQKRGYERMIVWRARKNPMPAGVDCTMELIHVHIMDQEITQKKSSEMRTMLGEHEVQLMFSSAVIRFINHVSNVVKPASDTMFEMAEKLNIPEWIVSLRHDTSHGSKLPDLSQLRMAVEFALGWLKDNYWSSASISNVEFSSEGSRFRNKRVNLILEVWQVLQMYKMEGYDTIDEIQDEELKNSVLKALNKRIKDDEEDTTWNESTSKLSYIIERLQLKFFLSLGSADCRTEKLVGMLMTSLTFIPPAHCISNDSKDLTEENISEWVTSIWKNILIPLQEKFGIFPTLVHRLITSINDEKNNHRQLVMALWINHLCISMLKSKMIIEDAYKNSKSIVQKDINDRMEDRELLKRRIDIPEDSFTRVVDKNPFLEGGYFALQTDEMENSCPVQDLRLAILNPNKYILIYLRSLLDVARPAIKDNAKNLLCQLVSIFNGTSDLNSRITCGLHTVEDLFRMSGKTYVNMEDSGAICEYNWATCPIGILPWQKRLSSILDIPPNIVWKESKDKIIETNEPVIEARKPDFKTKSKKVDWTAVKKHNSSIKTATKKRRLLLKKIKKSQNSPST